MNAFENGLGSSVGTARKFGPSALCRMCARPRSVRPLTRHHLVPLSWFEKLDEDHPLRRVRNATANLIPLCRQCHDLIEQRDEAERRKERKMLRKLLGQSEIAFAIALRGKSWLDHHYPLDRALVGL